MTSAHRPTFDHAKGKDNKNLSSITHKRGLPSHTRLKFRTKKRKTVSEFEEDEDETILNDGRKLDGVSGEHISGLVNELKSGTVEVATIGETNNDNSKSDETEKSGTKDDDNKEEDDEESSEDDSEDEEALLMEMEKIKKEREELKSKEEKAEIEKRAKNSNPLMLIDTESSKKRSWRDRKTMSKKTVANSESKFINDTVKSDFHKKFLDKYVR